MNGFIGMDVGTSGTKAVLFSDKGDILNTAFQTYALEQPQNGWAQQDPLDWKNAALQTLRTLAQNCGGAMIRGIGVSGQMHGLVLLDAHNMPLTDSIIWCDQRTGDEVQEICRVIGRQKYIELTCNAPNTSFTLTKLLWVRRHLPEVYAKIHKVLLPKDYVQFCLTGKFATDVSDASGTGYFSVRERDWCSEILEAFEIPRQWLPQVYESWEPVAAISRETAAYTGLPGETVVCAGAGDQAAAALGNGILQSGEVSISLGTSGVVFSAVDTPAYDPQGRVHTFCHSVPGKWHIMGVTQACGLSVSWFRHTFAEERSYRELDHAAALCSSDGVLFLPYLMGERTPHLDPDCRGVFAGLSARHSADVLYRAVLEGVCMSICDCDALLRELGVRARQTSVCGGGANSPLWLQILADMLGRSVCTGDSKESGAKGAAMLAAAASGVYADLETANRHMNQTAFCEIAYNADAHAAYMPAYHKYRALYPAVQSVMQGETETEVTGTCGKK